MPDGTERDWDYDMVRELGMMLTVDVNGNDATQAEFDPTQIDQYGFEPQRDDLRGLGASWGAGMLAAEDGDDGPDPRAVGGRMGLALRRDLPGPIHHVRAGLAAQMLAAPATRSAPGESPWRSTSCGRRTASVMPVTTGTSRPCPRTRARPPPLQRRHLPHHEGHTASRGGLHGAHLPAGRGVPELLRSTVGCPPGRPTRTAFFEGLTEQFRPQERRLAGRHRRRPVRRQPQLRGVRCPSTTSPSMS